eukprot:GFYU01015122.1.p1 GENE.GFYU01015122.1~~GFYU01015122.1.p1  ORF type:complete len:378 (+),score=129.02 GFYU01015122.1:45-1178(+)
MASTTETQTQSAMVYSLADDEGVRLVERPLPTLQPHDETQLLVKVICVGLNPVDAKYRVGDKYPSWLAWLGKRMVEGYLVGFDFAGIVAAVPESCTEFMVGDAVYGTGTPWTGTMSPMVSVPVNQVTKKPKNVTFAEAASVPLVGLTAIQSLKIDNELKAGENVLVIGASGGVGHVAVQVAKGLGARVTGVCSTRNIDMVKSLGCDHVIDYTAGDEAVQKLVAEEVKKQGRPFDIILDTVSSIEEKDRNYRYKEFLMTPPAEGVAIEGGEMWTGPLMSRKYVTIGGTPWDWVRAGLKRTVGLDLFPADSMLFWVRFPASSAALAEVTGLVEKGALKPKIYKEVAFTEEGVREAFRNLHERRVVGKIVVRLCPEDATL